MVWRGSPSNQDKLWSSLIYLIPLIEVLPLGFWLYTIFPSLLSLITPLLPLLAIYNLQLGGIAIVQWGLFIGLYVGVVNNSKLRHFLRYNALQSILLGILVALCLISLQLFGLSAEILPLNAGESLGSFFLVNIVYTIIFVFVVGSSLYSIIQSIRGLYPEIPIISQATYGQLR